MSKMIRFHMRTTVVVDIPLDRCVDVYGIDPDNLDGWGVADAVVETDEYQAALQHLSDTECDAAEVYTKRVSA